MMTNNISKYSKSSDAKRSKRIFAYLIDIFLELILAMLFLGAVFGPIFKAVPWGANELNALGEVTEKLQEITVESKLQDVNPEDKNILLPLEEQSSTYVKRSLNTYLYMNDLKIAGNPVDIKITLLDNVNGKEEVTKDGNYYYFTTYKKDKNIGTYGAYSSPSEYYYKEIIGEEKVKKFFEVKENETYYFLNSTAANYLNKYIYEGDTTDLPTEYYNEFLTIYLDTYQKGVDDLETNYTVYKDLMEVYKTHYVAYGNVLITEVFLSFLASHLVLFVIIPLCLKNGTTIGRKTFKIALCNLNGSETCYNKVLANLPISLVTNFYIMGFAVYFLYGTLGLTIYPFLGGLTLLWLMFVSALISLISFTLSFFNRGKLTLFQMAIFVKEVNTEEFVKSTDVVDTNSSNDNSQSVAGEEVSA